MKLEFATYHPLSTVLGSLAVAVLTACAGPSGLDATQGHAVPRVATVEPLMDYGVALFDTPAAASAPTPGLATVAAR